MGFLFKAFRVVAVIAAAFAVAVFLVANRPEPARQEIKKSVPVVEVMEAQSRDHVMEVSAFGTVKPRQTLQIAAEVSGRVDFLKSAFVEGGFVEKGEVLIGIDSRTYRLNLETAKVAVRRARADITRLKQEIENFRSDMVLARANQKLSAKELVRLQALGREEFASKTSLDRAEQRDIEARMALKKLENALAVTDSTMAQKEAALAGARLDMDKAELALEKTEIRCDFDGYVLVKKVEKGEFVSVGQPLGSLYAKGMLDVEVSIPLESMEWIGQVSDHSRPPMALVKMSGWKKRWSARLVRFKAGMDEKTRTLPMVLEIDDPGIDNVGFTALRPGSFVRCTIKGKSFDGIFVLPRHLLKPGNIFFVLENGNLVKKKVTVLRKFQEEIYVKDGIESGDKVIITPLPGAVDGMQVQEVQGIKGDNHS